jgi:hypothetical protein
VLELAANPYVMVPAVLPVSEAIVVDALSSDPAFVSLYVFCVVPTVKLLPPLFGIVTRFVVNVPNELSIVLDTVRVPNIPVEPVTDNPPVDIVVAPCILAVPLTSNLNVGADVPIPIFPLLLTNNNDVDPLNICNGAAVVADPVTLNEPDILASPVNGNAAPPPALVNANDAVNAYDALKAGLVDVNTEPETYDAVVANEAVPKSDPVMLLLLPDIINDFVIVTLLKLPESA